MERRGRNGAPYGNAHLATAAPTGASEQLRDRLYTVIDHRDRPALRPRELEREIDAERVQNRGGHFRRRDRPVLRIGTDLVRRPHDSTALHAAAGEEHAPALRPVVAA